MRKILLVEDEPIIRDSYLLMLSTQPYEVDFATNGQEALNKCAQKTYDLILLDLMMPIMTGIEFLQRFHPEKHHKTKVIIMSNLSSGIELGKALQLGAYASVLKAELSPRQFLTMVRYEIEAA